MCNCAKRITLPLEQSNSSKNKPSPLLEMLSDNPRQVHHDLPTERNEDLFVRVGVCVHLVFFFFSCFFAACQISAADYDTELLEGVLQRPHLVGRLAGTCLYGPLCERLLSLAADDDDRDDDEAAPRVRDIPRQLAEGGPRARAGHLLQLTDRLPRYLLNFSSALYFASHKKL